MNLRPDLLLRAESDPAGGSRGGFPAGALLLVLLAWAMASGAHHAALVSGVKAGDFKFFFKAAERLANGEHLYVYDPNGATYVYSPLLALLLRPLAGRGMDTAFAVFSLVNAGCVIVAAGLWGLATRGRRALVDAAPAAAVAAMMLLAFRFWPTVMTFGLGQSNVLLLVPLAAIAYFEKRRSPMGMAAAIAVGALFKTWFAGMVIYLILRRSYRAAGASALMYAAAMAVLFTIVGWAEAPLFVEMTRKYAGGVMGQQVIGQSWAGFVSLHFAPALPGAHVRPMIESPLVATALTIAGRVVMMGVLWWLWRKDAARRADTAPLTLGFVAITVLLLLPYCTPEYFVLALPALWALVLPAPWFGAVVVGPRPGWTAWVPAAVAFAAYVLFTRGGPFYPPVADGYTRPPMSLMVSLSFAAGAVLWAACLARLVMMLRSPAAVVRPVGVA